MILVIIVNWNGAAHTCTCLDSLALQVGERFDVVVCDNASSDGSISDIARHMERSWGLHADNFAPTDAQMMRFSPVENRSLVKEPNWRLFSIWISASNLGYAGGANAVMDWGMCAGYEGFWILNNDVSLAPDALEQVRRVAISDQRRGPVGSVLMHWSEPQRVQAAAGRFCHVLAVGSHLKKLPSERVEVLDPVDYPVGACLYVGREFVASVGPMDPNYFLYYEEMDWSERARRAGFRPVVASRSRARHREGASTGSPEGVRNKSSLSEYFGAVNRLRITARFWPWLVPLVWASLLLVVVERLLHAEWHRAWIVMRVMMGHRMSALRFGEHRKPLS